MPRRLRISGLAIAALLISLSIGAAGGSVDGGEAEAQPVEGQARNVIIFIGDGMGTSQRDLIRFSTVGPGGQLAMDDMPYAGRSQTSPEDPEAFVTDSAAGGTAIAAGVKTFNGAVGVDPAGNPVQTVLEAAKRSGKSAGLVTNSQVTDATPASFGAHVEDRDDQSEIARQFLEDSGPDVILGGGEDYWYPEGEEGAYPDNPPEDEEEQSEGTNGNLVERAEMLGYEYISDRQGLQAASGQKLLGLFANQEMFQQAPEGEGAAYDPVVPLSEMTEKSLDVLSRNPDGFFLMVEEEGIDEMAHQSNTELTVEAGQALDEAVAVGKDFAQEHPDTLVVVTADHETGSLAIEDTNEIQDDPEYPNETGEGRTAEDGPFRAANSDKSFVVDWTTANHTAEDVPVTAMGPGGENLVGVYENTHTHDAMMEALGLSGSEDPSDADARTMPGTGGATNVFGLAATALALGALILGSTLLALKVRG